MMNVPMPEVENRRRWYILFILKTDGYEFF